MRVAAVIAVALAVASPTTGASAATPSAALVHVQSGSTETAPGTANVLRGTDLAILNAPSNLSAYTYLLSNGSYTYGSGAVARGGVGAITVPTTAPAGTYTFSRIGSGIVLARVDVH